MTKRALVALVPWLFVLACGPFASVPLLTGVPPHGVSDTGQIGCYTSAATGLLRYDPTVGTTIEDETAMTLAPVAVPIMWLPGFSARRLGSEVEVLDADGNVVATSGRRYRIDGGYVGGDSSWPEQPLRVFWACARIVAASTAGSLPEKSSVRAADHDRGVQPAEAERG